MGWLGENIKEEIASIGIKVFLGHCGSPVSVCLSSSGKAFSKSGQPEGWVKVERVFWTKGTEQKHRMWNQLVSAGNHVLIEPEYNLEALSVERGMNPLDHGLGALYTNLRNLVLESFNQGKKDAGSFVFLIYQLAVIWETELRWVHFETGMAERIYILKSDRVGLLKKVT